MAKLGKKAVVAQFGFDGRRTAMARICHRLGGQGQKLRFDPVVKELMVAINQICASHGTLEQSIPCKDDALFLEVEGNASRRMARDMVD